MNAEDLVPKLDSTLQFLNRSTSVLEEADSAFAPGEGMFTVAQSLAHVAGTVDWFMDGAFVREDGFDMDFEGEIARARECTSLAEARNRVNAAFSRARSILLEQEPDALMSPLPPGEIMGGLPRVSVLDGIAEHTAHHRGALTVYARLLGRVSPMPYE